MGPRMEDLGIDIISSAWNLNRPAVRTLISRVYKHGSRVASHLGLFFFLSTVPFLQLGFEFIEN